MTPKEATALQLAAHLQLHQSALDGIYSALESRGYTYDRQRRTWTQLNRGRLFCWSPTDRALILQPQLELRP